MLSKQDRVEVKTSEGGTGTHRQSEGQQQRYDQNSRAIVEALESLQGSLEDGPSMSALPANTMDCSSDAPTVDATIGGWAASGSRAR